MRDTIEALRADQWLMNHPDADVELRARIKRQVRDAFYCDADDWKSTVHAQALAASLAAVSRLGVPGN